MVRFEGVPGEFAQFDFGECDIRLGNGSTRRVHFACYRLKYSRWMYVQVVPDQKVESLIRALLNGFASAGGVPLSVVFDRPKTVVIGKTRRDSRNGIPRWLVRPSTTASSSSCACHEPAGRKGRWKRWSSS